MTCPSSKTLCIQSLLTDHFLAAQDSFRELAENEGAEGAFKCLQAASTIYNETPETDRGLRDILLDAVNRHIKEVVDEDENHQKILKNVPDLAYELVKTRAAKSLGKPARSPIGCCCPDCGNTFPLCEKTFGDIVYCPACVLCDNLTAFTETFRSTYFG